MNKITMVLLAMIMLFLAGCALTGESYTDEGKIGTPIIEANTLANKDSSESPAELPEIAAYDEPEIPALDAPATE